jgi:hypothetical protein
MHVLFIIIIMVLSCVPLCHTLCTPQF